MTVKWHQAEDAATLAQRIRTEANAKQRDRYRVVLLAGEGEDGAELSRDQIAVRVGRSRQFVDEWVGRYRRDGTGSLTAKKQPGAACRLTSEQQEQLRQMLDTGPDPAEGLAAWNGPILKETIGQKFGVVYALSGLYKLLHHLRYNDLMPRPVHPDTDPAAMEAFKKRRCPGRSTRPWPTTPANGSWSTTRTRHGSASTAP